MGRRHARFDCLVPVSDRYASLPVGEAFTWDACAAGVAPGEWYMVVFRSVHRPGADAARLTAYDDWAHEEAKTAPGFVHYFKGPAASDGSCMSFCLWDSRADARAAAGKPRHAQAAAIVHDMYERFQLEFHRVRRVDGGFTFEDYDPQPVAHERIGPATLLPGLAAT